MSGFGLLAQSDRVGALPPTPRSISGKMKRMGG